MTILHSVFTRPLTRFSVGAYLALHSVFTRVNSACIHTPHTPIRFAPSLRVGAGVQWNGNDRSCARNGLMRGTFSNQSSDFFCSRPGEGSLRRRKPRRKAINRDTDCLSVENIRQNIEITLIFLRKSVNVRTVSAKGAPEMSEDSPAITGRKPESRSRITNGSKLVEGLDGRTKWGRRYRDVVESLAGDLGGMEVLTSAQLSMCKRAATLTVEIERHEAAFADRGEADSDALREFQTACNSLRRLLESLGLSRSGKTAGTREPDPFTIEGEGVRLMLTNADGARRMSPEGRQIARMLAFAISHAVATNAKVSPALAEFAASTGLVTPVGDTSDER